MLKENTNVIIPLITVFFGGLIIGLTLLAYGIYLLKHKEQN